MHLQISHLKPPIQTKTMKNTTNVLASSSINTSSTIMATKSYNYRRPSIPILFILTISAALFLLAPTQNNQVSCLKCYHCSSADDPGCDEQFTSRANYTDTDCEKFINREAKVCRKIIQNIEDKTVVIRSCGYVDAKENAEKFRAEAIRESNPSSATGKRLNSCMKRAGTMAIMMESCSCYTDNCNSSTSLVPNKLVSVVIVVLISALLAFKNIHVLL